MRDEAHRRSARAEAVLLDRPSGSKTIDGIRRSGFATSRRNEGATTRSNGGDCALRDERNQRLREEGLQQGHAFE
jgi:hypothetical protein